MFERPDVGNRALLVYTSGLPGSNPAEDDAACEEFVELTRSAGLAVCDIVTARRSRPDPRTFVGRGKIGEIAAAREAHEADVVLFGQSLAPSQERNLERELGARVFDRNTLILDIFAQRARSFEGKLQVELAQLEHLSTRLVRGWTHLERQKGGIGLRGPGETQLETDRRLLGERVRVLRRRLDKVRRQREQGRAKRARSGIATITLAGYTNAGKSTLFNRLAEAGVYAADQLFATLDPTLRRLSLDNGTTAVLADTVGFIRELPHELVDAFRSTLTEAREADLLLHVIDHSDESRDARRTDVEDVLDEIGAGDVAQLIVFNKVDMSGQTPRIERDVAGVAQAVWVSAATGAGLDLLRQAITERLAGERVAGWLHLRPEQGRLRSQLFGAAVVTEEQNRDDGSSVLHIDMDSVDFARLAREHHIHREFVPDRAGRVA